MVRGKGVGPVEGPISAGAVPIECAVVVRRRVDGRGRMVDAHRHLAVEGATPLDALHLLTAAVAHVRQSARWTCTGADLPVADGAGTTGARAPLFDALAVLVAPREPALAARP